MCFCLSRIQWRRFQVWLWGCRNVWMERRVPERSGVQLGETSEGGNAAWQRPELWLHHWHSYRYEWAWVRFCPIATSVTFKYTVRLHISMVETGRRVKDDISSVFRNWNETLKRRISHPAGSFVGVSKVESQDLSTAVLISPVIRECAATCRLRLRYFLWDSGKGCFFGVSAFWKGCEM